MNTFVEDKRDNKTANETVFHATTNSKVCHRPRPVAAADKTPIMFPL